MTHRLVTLLPGRAPWLMGILNVTPDSFSDGGRFLDPAAAVAQARRLTAQGAAVIDVGGESTAPGSTPLDDVSELARIEPVVTALAADTVLSIDTYHARTAARCLELGARIVNDTSAGRAEPGIGAVVREHDAVLVLMHAKDGPLPHATGHGVVYEDVVREVGDWLVSRVDWALGQGLILDQLVVDPGMGRFVSLEPQDSWRLLDGFAALAERVAPVPVMIGTSRKGFLGVEPAALEAVSQLTATVAAYRGAALIRTHDVGLARQFLATWRRLRLALPAASRLVP